MRTLCAVGLALSFLLPAYGQGLALPPASDPFWKTETGALFIAQENQIAQQVYGASGQASTAGSGAVPVTCQPSIEVVNPRDGSISVRIITDYGIVSPILHVETDTTADSAIVDVFYKEMVDLNGNKVELLLSERAICTVVPRFDSVCDPIRRIDPRRIANIQYAHVQLLKTVAHTDVNKPQLDTATFR